MSSVMSESQEQSKKNPDVSCKTITNRCMFPITDYGFCLTGLFFPDINAFQADYPECPPNKNICDCWCVISTDQITLQYIISHFKVDKMTNSKDHRGTRAYGRSQGLARMAKTPQSPLKIKKQKQLSIYNIHIAY